MSSIPTVKAAVVALLSEALTETQVIYGNKDAVTTLSDRILTVGGVVNGQMDFSSLDLTGSTERYTLDCIASASLATYEQQAADDLALADFTAAVARINTHNFGPQTSVHCTGSFQLEEGADKNGRHAAVRFGLEVFAVV